MYDKSLVVEIMQQIIDASKKVSLRFGVISCVEDFTDTPEGMEKLDAICMQLIAIGESVKNIDKITDKKLLSNYPNIDWKGVKGMRDIISHHYFDLDAEEIYFVCDSKIEELTHTLEKILKDLQ